MNMEQLKCGGHYGHTQVAADCFGRQGLFGVRIHVGGNAFKIR